MPTESAVTLDDGARLWTTNSGTTDGPPIVLCHGGPGLWDDLAPIAAMLDDRHRVHRFDQRGCGRSTGPDDYRVERALADLDRLRQHWGYDSWSVFGHSWGAHLVLAYAWTYPSHVSAVVHCGGTGPGDEWRPPYRAENAKRLTSQQRERLAELEERDRTWDEEVEFRTLSWLPSYVDPARARAAAQVPYAINWRANRELWTNRPDLEAHASKVTAPTLLLHGEQDPRPLANVHRLLDLIPNATLETVQEAGHSPWVEQPAAVAASLDAFLA